jgi:hypothetical protein
MQDRFQRLLDEHEHNRFAHSDERHERHNALTALLYIRDQRISQNEKEIDSLRKFVWMLTGGFATISFIGTSGLVVYAIAHH